MAFLIVFVVSNISTIIGGLLYFLTTWLLNNPLFIVVLKRKKQKSPCGLYNRQW